MSIYLIIAHFDQIGLIVKNMIVKTWLLKVEYVNNSHNIMRKPYNDASPVCHGSSGKNIFKPIATKLQVTFLRKWVKRNGNFFEANGKNENLIIMRIKTELFWNFIEITLPHEFSPLNEQNVL